ERHDLAADTVHFPAGVLAFQRFVEVARAAIVAQHPEAGGEHAAMDAVIGGDLHQRTADAAAAIFLQHVDHADLGIPRRESFARGADHGEADDFLVHAGDEDLFVEILSPAVEIGAPAGDEAAFRQAIEVGAIEEAAIGLLPAAFMDARDASGIRTAGQANVDHPATPSDIPRLMCAEALRKAGCV